MALKLPQKGNMRIYCLSVALHLSLLMWVGATIALKDFISHSAPRIPELLPSLHPTSARSVRMPDDDDPTTNQETRKTTMRPLNSS